MQNFTTASLNGHLEMEEQILQPLYGCHYRRRDFNVSRNYGFCTYEFSLSPANEFFGGVEKCAEPLLQYGEESVFKCHV